MSASVTTGYALIWIGVPVQPARYDWWHILLRYHAETIASTTEYSTAIEGRQKVVH